MTTEQLILGFRPPKGYGIGTTPPTLNAVDLSADGTQFLVMDAIEPAVSPYYAPAVNKLSWLTAEVPEIMSTLYIPAPQASGTIGAFVEGSVLDVPMEIASGSIIGDVIANSSVTIPKEEADGLIIMYGSIWIAPMEETGDSSILYGGLLNSTVTVPAIGFIPGIIAEVIPNPLQSHLSIPLETANGGIGVLAINVLPMELVSGNIVTGSVTQPFSLPVTVPMIQARGSFLYAFGSSQNIPFPNGSGIVLYGNLLESQQNIPVPIADGSGYQPTIMSSKVKLPIEIMLAVILESVYGSNVFAIAMHSERQAPTLYQNYPFNSFAVINGKTYAAGEGGFFELAGDDDNGAKIQSDFMTGISDFNIGFLKRVPDMHVGYKATGNLTITVTTDPNGEIDPTLQVNKFDYTLYASPPTGMHPVRVKFGRGLMARYWQFRIKNVDGCDFSINQMTIDPIATQRRVGGTYA